MGRLRDGKKGFAVVLFLWVSTFRDCKGLAVVLHASLISIIRLVLLVVLVGKYVWGLQADVLDASCS